MNSNHSSKVKEELSSIILLLRRNYAFFLVLAMYILSSSLWLIVELQKLYSFHAFVYDLGAQVSSLNSIARTYSISKLLILVPTSKPFTLFISYITLVFPDPGTFLYIQSFGTLLASVFIYLIARRKYGSEPISVALALSFIFFFPISWYLFFDFHIAGFFSTFFFAAFYFMDNRPKLSWILYFFAATTNIVMAFFVIIFLIINEADHFRRAWGQKHSFDIRKNLKKAALLLAPIPSIIFAGWQYKLTGLASFNGGVSSTSQSIISGYLGNLVSLFNQGFIIIFLMAILFIVIFALVIEKGEIIYILSILPVIAFILFGGYTFSSIKAQYDGEYFTPILFFLILLPTFSAQKKDNEKITLKVPIQNGTIKKKGILLFVILIIFMGIFYNPYGPLNNPNLPGINAYANFGHEINVTSSDRTANQFVGLVPRNSTVMIEDSEPQYANRPRNFVFGPGNLPWLSTSFYDEGPKPSSTVPQFIAVDVNNAGTSGGWYTFPFYNSSDGSMSTWFPYFYSHYHYGLLAYSYPFYLYKLNYTGDTVISSGMNFIGSNYVYHESTVTFYSFNGSLHNWPLFNTFYKIFLLPANYKFSFGFTANNLTGNISIEASNGVSTFARSFNLSDYSGPLNYSLNMTVIAPSDYTFSVVSSGLKGEITKYSSEYLTISDFSPNTVGMFIYNQGNKSSESVPMMLTLKSSQLNYANNRAWTNIGFFSGANPISSWLEAYNSTTAVYWINPGSIPPGGSKDITIMAFQKNVSVMNGLSVGEAPELSHYYGQFDNGVYVFGHPSSTSGYYNFKGNILNPFLRAISGGYGLPGGSILVNNGLYLNGFNNGAAYEAVGTGASVSNSIIMGWGFGSTQNTAGVVLNGPSLGGYSDSIYVANSSGKSTLSFGNESTNYKTVNLLNLNLAEENNVAIAYGINRSVSVYSNGRFQTISSPVFSFNNYVGATVSYSSNTFSQRFSPEIFYLFIVPLSSSYVGLSYAIN